MSRLAVLLVFAALSFGAEPQKGVLVEHVASRADPSQTYTLYLPSSYDSKANHPLLFVFDPGARATSAATIFRDAAEEYGWIVISSAQTQSGAPGERNDRAVRALLPEVSRYASDPRRIYAAGFSAMAMLSWDVGIQTATFAGVVGVGGRVDEALAAGEFSFAHYGFAGDTDFNNRDMRRLDEMLEREGKIHRFEEFPGDHRWITPALARDALGWLEVVAMKEGRREVDAQLVARLFDAEMTAAAATEKASALSALRRYRVIARTYDGIHPTDRATAAIARLEPDARVAREHAAEARWDAFEAAYTADVSRRVPSIFRALKEKEGDLGRELMRELRVADLKRRARRSDLEGTAARRLLEGIYTQTAHVVPYQLFDLGEYKLAAAALAVAAEIHPERWIVWYTLGGAHARSGNSRRALAALAKAIDLGFDDEIRLKRDKNYGPVREAAEALLRTRTR